LLNLRIAQIINSDVIFSQLLVYHTVVVALQPVNTCCPSATTSDVTWAKIGQRYFVGMVQKRGLTSEPTLDYDPENGFQRGACPRF